jgi:hypothetical protein
MKPLKHYLLFGSPSAHGTRSMLLGAWRYIVHFGTSFGFDANAATSAADVTIMGDGRAIDLQVDQHLVGQGCRVERLGGDQYSIDPVLASRIALNSEFGDTLGPDRR